MEICFIIIHRVFIYLHNDAERLQSVQNAAARLVYGARRRDHITPVLIHSFIH